MDLRCVVLRESVATDAWQVGGAGIRHLDG
jgi:hypothetical protein